MPQEFDTAVAASAGGFLRRGHGPTAPPGTPCGNCGAILQGPWCHDCGQLGKDFHRSTWHLCAEAVEGLFHLDGRLWRTLPDLMFRPGRLTKAYLEGHRSPQIPPLRLFLVVLLAIFLIGGLTAGPGLGRVHSTTTTETNGRLVSTGSTTVGLSHLSPTQRAKLGQAIDSANVELGGTRPNVAATAWLRDRLKRTIDDPQRFYLILEQWSERFAFLMLPVAALLLSLAFVFQRQFYLFDHTIFSLHSLSANGLLICAVLTLSSVFDEWAFLLLLAVPIHLFVHMRGVYRRSVLGTLTRMTVLSLGSLAAALLLVFALVAVGLNGMSE